MHLELVSTAEEAVERAADTIAERLGRALESRRRASLALSRAADLLDALLRRPLAWDRVDVFQVDERAAPRGSEDRNLTALENTVVMHGPLHREHLFAMPVDGDLERGASEYARLLRDRCGDPPVLDVVHLGLGPDGHTASLLPGDPVLDVDDADVAISGTAGGFRRMTLTYPVLDRAQALVWLVTGLDKARAVQALVGGSRDVPAGRVRSDRSVLVLDHAAASMLSP